jgi:hypothetical protein
MCHPAVYKQESDKEEGRLGFGFGIVPFVRVRLLPTVTRLPQRLHRVDEVLVLDLPLQSHTS